MGSIIASKQEHYPLQNIQIISINTESDDTINLNSAIISFEEDNVNPLKIYFSDINKHDKLEISQDSQVVKDKSFSSFKIIACDPVIPAKGNHEFTFSINQCGNVYIGICIFEKINFEMRCIDIWSQINHGAYLLSQDGFIFSNHKPEDNKLETSLKFKENDKIIVQVNQEAKTISWKKQETNEIISIQIQNDKDLHPFLIIDMSQISII